MPRFRYRAKKGLEETVEGTLEAECQDVAVTHLVEMGLVPIRVEPEPRAPVSKVRYRKLRRRVSSRDLNIFTGQLYSLVKARVELLSSLNILHGQTESLRLREIIRSLYNSVKDGRMFSEALSKYPKYFSPLYTSMVRSGETSGRLDEALAQISEFMEREEGLKIKVRAALAYPALMIIVAIITVFVLVSFVIPKLSVIFADLGQSLPLPTRILLEVSGFFSRGWFWIVGVVLIFIIFSFWGKRTHQEHVIWARVKMRLPIVGKIIKNQSIAHFSRTLGLLLQRGIPILQALQVATPTVGSPVMIRELEKVRREVMDGSSLTNSMEKVGSLPNFFIQMVAVGEEGGRLDEVLYEVANAYTREVEADLKTVTSLLEPLTILGLGLVLGAIVMAMLLPILQMSLVAG